MKILSNSNVEYHGLKVVRLKICLTISLIFLSWGRLCRRSSNLVQIVKFIFNNVIMYLCLLHFLNFGFLMWIFLLYVELTWLVLFCYLSRNFHFPVIAWILFGWSLIITFGSLDIIMLIFCMLARSCSVGLDLVRCLLWSAMIICWITIQGLWSIHFISVPRWFSVCELLTVHWCGLDLLIQGSIRSTFHFSGPLVHSFHFCS